MKKLPYQDVTLSVRSRICLWLEKNIDIEFASQNLAAEINAPVMEVSRDLVKLKRKNLVAFVRI